MTSTQLRAAGLLTLAPVGALCQGSTPYSGSTFACNGFKASDGTSGPNAAVHAWTVGGETRTYCGYHSPFDVTDAEREALTAREVADEATLARVLDLEFTVWQGRQCLPLAVNRAEAVKGLRADQRRLHAALDALTLEETKAYGDYRRANKWWALEG